MQPVLPGDTYTLGYGDNWLAFQQLHKIWDNIIADSKELFDY